jgi:acyl-CoA thioester hydrolase
MLQHYMQSRDFTVFANRINFSKVQFKALRAETLYMPYMIAKGALMDKTDFSHAILDHADLRLAGLRQAKLVGASFTSAIMNGVLLLKSDLTEAVLVQVAMTDATLSHAVLVKADLSGAKLSFSKFDHADLRQANLTGATLFQTNFQDANLCDANLEGALLEKTNFTNANLQRARFAGARLDRPNFTGANLEGATGINETRTATAPLEVRPLPGQPSEPDLAAPKADAAAPANGESPTPGRPAMRANRSDWILTSRLSATMPARRAAQAAAAPTPRPAPTPAELIAALKAAGRLPADYTHPAEADTAASAARADSTPNTAAEPDPNPLEPTPAAVIPDSTETQTLESAPVAVVPEPAAAVPEPPPEPPTPPKPEPRIFEHAIRVPYADADPMGVVYYANYLMYFDMARASMFRQAGLPYAVLIKHGLLLPVLEAACSYKAPARCDDLLTARVWCDDVQESRIRLVYEIRRENRLLASGHTLHLCVSAQGKVVQPFPELLKLLGR